MKNRYFLLLSLFFLAGCSKNDIPSPAKSPNTSLIVEVENLSSNTVAQKLAYRLLNNTDKAALWNAQIDYYLSADLNDGQKEKLQELKSIITPQIFDKAYFVKNYEAFSKEWSKAAEQIFPRDVLYAIVSHVHSRQFASDLVSATNARNFSISNNLSAISVKVRASTPLDSPAKPACTCSTVSTYCAQFETCNGSFFGGCVSSTYGCGFLLLYACNGQCGAGA